jgi:hypothetical protein
MGIGEGRGCIHQRQADTKDGQTRLVLFNILVIICDRFVAWDTQAIMEYRRRHGNRILRDMIYPYNNHYAMAGNMLSLRVLRRSVFEIVSCVHVMESFARSV